MSPAVVFQAANSTALAAWILLLVFPRWKYVRAVTVSVFSSLILAGAYAACLFLGMSGGAEGNFNSLEGVAKLFENPWALTAGWIHYLAFDLFVGSWISAHSQKNGISRWIALPCQVMTFLFGPTGLLLYLAVRALRNRSEPLADPF